MLTDAKREAIKKYDLANTVQIKMKLNINTDADIIEQLEKMKLEEGGKQGYIKALIREDIIYRQATKNKK